MCVKFFKIILLSFIAASSAFVSHSILAANVTPNAKQIEQFKKLPQAQQEALAKKYGIDLSVLQSDEKTKNNKEKKLPSVFPREEEVELDEQIDEEEKFKPKQQELEPFGYNLFAGEPTTFMPSENALVPETYLVGAGDTFTITLYGKESGSYEVMVDREGRLAIPNLAPVNVAGMQFSDVKKLVKKKVKQEIIGVDAFISMGTLRSMRVLVLGEAHKPGAYTVPALASITHALFVSGGVTEIGSLRNIQVKRAGKTVATLDLYSLLISGDSSGDIFLKSGDVVFIPPVGKQVAMSGQVRRPAIFELKKGEGARDLITMAGGLKSNAFAQKTVVERFKGNSFKTVLQLDLNKKRINYTPQDGDKIIVPESTQELENAVTLMGAVTYPGNYAWQADYKITHLLSSLKADLLPVADYDYALIIREKNTRGDIEILQFSPSLAVEGKIENNLALKPRDILVIFSRYEEKEKEKQVLSSMALTEEQIALQEKMELWQEYENKKFHEFIGLELSLDQELEQKLALEKDKNIDSLTKLLRGETNELTDEEYSVFSRKLLLRPILQKLHQQASYNDEVAIFGINGEVPYPGIYPLPLNPTLHKATIAAGGVKEAAYLERAEITRFKRGENTQVEHLTVNLKQSLQGDMVYNIKSKDAINIFPTPNWQENISIRVLGEVRFPGQYTIKRGETLDSVLKRAGGFTEFSFPRGAVFTRESIRLQEQQQLRKLSEDLRREIASRSFQNSITDSSLSYSDMDNLLKDLSDVDALGRLVINLPAVEKGKQVLELKDNDTLYVPSKPNTVSVIGEVNVSTSHVYQSNLSVADYIERSGGLKQRADDDRIYIIKANGGVEVPSKGSWFAVNQTAMLEPGDTIVVPLNAEYIDSLTLWSTATQILYQVGVAVAAIGSLNK